MIFIVISLAVFLFFMIRASRYNTNFRTMSGLMTAGISASISILVFPYFLANNGNVLFGIFGAIRYGVSAVALGATKEVTQFFNTGGSISAIYVSLLYFFYVMGPISASAFVFSFARSIFETLKLKGHRIIHIFSSLNPESINIAESIVRNREKERVFFCSNSLDGDDPLTERALAIGALNSKKSISSIYLMKKQRYELYVMEDSRDATFEVLTSLCDSLSKKEQLRKQNITVRYPASISSIELIREIDRTYGSALNLRPIDIYSSQAVNIFRRYSDTLVGKKHKTLVIVGAGDLGNELLRTGATLLIEPDSTYTIHVIDRDAKNILSQLKAKAPEVINLDEESYFRDDHDENKNYDIVFHTADAQSSAFIDVLEKIEKPDLICIFTGNDEVNYLTAKTCMRTYGRLSSDLSYPQICTRIRSYTFRNSLNDTENVYYFGDSQELFNIDSLVMPQLEKAAKRVHLTYLTDVYEGLKDRSEEEQEQILEETGFYSYANQDSSFNEALAMEFKYRYICGLDKEDRGEDFVREWLNDEANLISLADMEHLRWNAYQRFLGWKEEDPFQEEEMSKRTEGKKLKNDDLLLHPALVELKDLPEAERRADGLLRKYNPDYTPTRYVELDRQMCRNMLYILDME